MFNLGLICNNASVGFVMYKPYTAREDIRFKILLLDMGKKGLLIILQLRPASLRLFGMIVNIYLLS